jgi:hypothetical protein
MVADTFRAERHVWCASEMFFDSSFEASDLDKEKVNSKNAKNNVL